MRTAIRQIRLLPSNGLSLETTRAMNCRKYGCGAVRPLESLFSFQLSSETVSPVLSFFAPWVRAIYKNENGNWAARDTVSTSDTPPRTIRRQSPRPWLPTSKREPVGDNEHRARRSRRRIHLGNSVKHFPVSFSDRSRSARRIDNRPLSLPTTEPRSRRSVRLNPNRQGEVGDSAVNSEFGSSGERPLKAETNVSRRWTAQTHRRRTTRTNVNAVTPNETFLQRLLITRPSKVDRKPTPNGRRRSFPSEESSIRLSPELAPDASPTLQYTWTETHEPTSLGGADSSKPTIARSSRGAELTSSGRAPLVVLSKVGSQTHEFADASRSSSMDGESVTPQSMTDRTPPSNEIGPRDAPEPIQTLSQVVPDLDHLVDQVYERLERKGRIERERRGL